MKPLFFPTVNQCPFRWIVEGVDDGGCHQYDFKRTDQPTNKQKQNCKFLNEGMLDEAIEKQHTLVGFTSL